MHKVTTTVRFAVDVWCQLSHGFRLDYDLCLSLELGLYLELYRREWCALDCTDLHPPTYPQQLTLYRLFYALLYTPSYSLNPQ